MLPETDRKKRKAGSVKVSDFEWEWSEKDKKRSEIYQQHFYFKNIPTKWQEYELKSTSKRQKNEWKVIKETDTLNEVEYNEGQNMTKFISQVIAVVSIKQHVSAYSEAINRFTILATGDY